MGLVEQGSRDRSWEADLEAHHVIDAEIAVIPTTSRSGTAQPHLRCLLGSHHPSPADLLKLLPPPAALLLRVSRRTRQVVGLRVVTSTVATHVAAFQNLARDGASRVYSVGPHRAAGCCPTGLGSTS